MWTVQLHSFLEYISDFVSHRVIGWTVPKSAWPTASQQWPTIQGMITTITCHELRWTLSKNNACRGTGPCIPWWETFSVYSFQFDVRTRLGRGPVSWDWLKYFVGKILSITDENVLPRRVQGSYPVWTMEDRLARRTALVNVGDIHLGRCLRSPEILQVSTKAWVAELCPIRSAWLNV